MNQHFVPRPAHPDETEAEARLRRAIDEFRDAAKAVYPQIAWWGTNIGLTDECPIYVTGYAHIEVPRS